MVTGISEKQKQARMRSLAIIEKNKKLRSELDSKINELDLRTKQPCDLAARSNYDRRSSEQEKRMVCDFLPLFFPSFVGEVGSFSHLCLAASVTILFDEIPFFFETIDEIP